MNKELITAEPIIADVALPVPLRKTFEYLIPQELVNLLAIGMRVKVPFGRQNKIGLITQIKSKSQFALNKLKPITQSVDDDPLISADLLKLYVWLSEYYQAPIGEVIKLAMPGLYQADSESVEFCYQLNAEIDIKTTLETLIKAPQQHKALQHLLSQDACELHQSELKTLDPALKRAYKQLLEKNIILTQTAGAHWPQYQKQRTTPPKLTPAQTSICDKLRQHQDHFHVTLLKGITGSGKTEVYLHYAEAILKLDRQVLVLIPEIALTPQLIQRFEQRLGQTAAVLHSGLSKKQRQQAFAAAAKGLAKVIIGTRSAIFTAASNLGLIILDEEHDGSYKQQEGIRYHARDVAIIRAKLENLPILLGSATPSLESLANCKRKRYELLELNQRIGNATLPTIHLLAKEQLPVREGISITLLNAIEKNLKQRQQSLIFINRRGFAPVIMCKSCNESQNCDRCNARLTFHNDQSLRCHHCGHEINSQNRCLYCDSDSLMVLGQGTQRIETVLEKCFPQANIARFDRDNLRGKDQLTAALSKVSEQKTDILVGTQLLSKGHDFPNVTLVGILNADNGLFGVDFHSTETMVQQLIQVSGRSGRGDNPGKVLIQTDFPQHPIYQYILNHDYLEFADQELRLRERSNFPPYQHLALLRVSALEQAMPMQFLLKLKRQSLPLQSQYPQVVLNDPVPSPMAKRNNRYRAQLLISSGSRKARNAFLNEWVRLIEAQNTSRQLRWSIDVDPIDLY